MTDLDPRDRTLLDLARDGHEPTDADRGRVRAALVVRLGAGAGLLAIASTTAAETATAAVGAGAAAATVAEAAAPLGAHATVSAASLIGAVVLAGVVGGGGVAAYHAARGARPENPTRTLLAAAAPMTTKATAMPMPATEPAPIIPPAIIPPAPPTEGPSATVSPGGETAHAALLAPRPGSGANERARAVAVTRALPGPATEDGTPPSVELSADPFAPTAAPPARPPRAPTTLESETHLLRAGIASLHAGDAARALALFDEHARAFPNGALAEERAAERIVSLCDLGRNADARAAAAAFLDDHRRSPLAARIRATCGVLSNR